MSKDIVSENLEWLKSLEDMYEEIFGTKGMDDFIELATNNIEEKYKKDNLAKLCFRLTLEELLVYAIATEREKGRDKVIEILKADNYNIEIKPYEELEKYYAKYLSKIRKHLNGKPFKGKS